MFGNLVIRRRVVTTLVLIASLAWSAPVSAQTHTWNGPFTGTTVWSAGTWSTTPPAGGGSGTTLIFNQRGAGTYIANNDLGPTFQLSTITFASAGGGIDIGNAAGNTLEIVGTGAINQNGLGVQSISATIALTATNTTISGSGPGSLQIGGVLSGAGGLTINNPQALTYTGLVDLTGANTFTGGVTLQAGNLRVGNATALGTGTLTINGGTIGATATTIIANAVNLNADLVYSGFSNLTLTGVIGETGGPRRLVLSTMGTSTITLQGANTYSGETLVEINPLISTNGPGVGSLTFSGVNGSAINSSSFTMNGGGTLTLDNNVAGGNNNRIGDGAPVTISGGTLLLAGVQSAATLEDIGALSGRGVVTVTINAGTTGNTGTTLQANGLTRVDGGQFLFRANNASFGAPLGANVANLLFDTAPGLVGGGGVAGTTTISIIPFAIGGIAIGSTGTDLVTYGPNGVRPLSTTANEYATTILSGASTADNVRLTAAAAVTAPTTINALVTAVATPFTGSTSTLTVTSGTVLTTTATAEIPLGMTLDFGSAEGNVFTPAGLIVNGVLTGTNGLTKGGVSSLVLNNTANNVTGTLTVNRGFLEFPDPAALSSFSNIRVNGFATAATPSLILTALTGTFTLNKPIEVTSGYAQIFTDGGTLVISGQITGSGGVFINGGVVELTNATNSYTGQTRVFGGNLVIGSDAVLGNGGGVDFGAFATEGLRLSGNWTTSRSINFSFSSQVDTNGFAWTVNSPVTGVAGTINKVGAGMWVLAQGGSLGQSLGSGVGGTSTTLNINAGELRVTNPTGSATGTATVNIGSATLAATLSGTGQIAGITTIGAAATVSPGTGSNAGTLTFGSNLTLNGTFLVDAAADRIVTLGGLTLGAASILDMTAATFDPGTTYTLATYATLTGTFATVNGLPLTHTLNYGVSSITVAPVPEPATVLLIASAALGAGAAVRRRSRVCGSPV